MSYTYDRSPTVTVVICDECAGAWRDVAPTQARAVALAAAHEARCHPDVMSARESLSLRHRRATRP